MYISDKSIFKSHRDCIGKFLNRSENVRRSYEIFIGNIYFAKIVKVFERIIIRCINYLVYYLVRPFLPLITCLRFISYNNFSLSL